LHLVDINEQTLAVVGQEVEDLGRRPRLHVCDLQSSSQISQMLGEVQVAGGIDLLINNAGVGYCGPTHEMDSEHWERILAINLHAPIQIIRELLPSLLKRPEAHIVNISSMLGLFPGPKAAAYTVSKFGLQGLSESLRSEYGRAHLGVSAICPGFAMTGFFDAARRAGSPHKMKFMHKWLMTTPEHIAERTIVAIRRNQPVAVISPLAQFLYLCKRLAPNLFLRLFTGRYSPAAEPAKALAPTWRQEPVLRPQLANSQRRQALILSPAAQPLPKVHSY
jgi:short-subunit dehydrogenase